LRPIGEWFGREDRDHVLGRRSASYIFGGVLAT